MVLGIDGMDPNLLQHYIAEGKMPNARKLAEMGGFRPLTTSMPPQSPVAWANFITGMNPGGHGIFDFIHREPETFMPYLSTSKTLPPQKSISFGDWVLYIAICDFFVSCQLFSVFSTDFSFLFSLLISVFYRSPVTDYYSLITDY